MRRAAKVDGNQSVVVRDLRSCGVSVQHLHAIGQGCPDILCGWKGRNWAFEIKDPAQPPSKRRLTDDEIDWHKAWSGQVSVIETAEDALRIMLRDTADPRGPVTITEV